MITKVSQATIDAIQLKYSGFRITFKWNILQYTEGKFQSSGLDADMQLKLTRWLFSYYLKPKIHPARYLRTHNSNFPISTHPFISST